VRHFLAVPDTPSRFSTLGASLGSPDAVGGVQVEDIAVEAKPFGLGDPARQLPRMGFRAAKRIADGTNPANLTNHPTSDDRLAWSH